MIEPRSEYEYGTAAIHLACYTPETREAYLKATRRAQSNYIKRTRLDRNHNDAARDTGSKAAYRRAYVRCSRGVFKNFPAYFALFRNT